MENPQKRPPNTGAKTFIALAGAILSVFLLSGGVPAFGLFYTAEQQEGDQKRLDSVYRSADGASSAAIAFNRHLQEWKNILLRGGIESQSKLLPATSLFERLIWLINRYGVLLRDQYTGESWTDPGCGRRLM